MVDMVQEFTIKRYQVGPIQSLCQTYGESTPNIIIPLAGQRASKMGAEEETNINTINNSSSPSEIVNGSLIFTYGTLKRGFSNHCLMQDLILTSDALYLGVYRTVTNYPLVCGPYRVPFLLNFPGSGDRIWGELYAVSERGLGRLDELEGLTRNHYERLPIEIVKAEDGEKAVKAEAYYGHRSFAEKMWKKNGEKGLSEYSQEEAKGYVKRTDRPANVSFLDQIRFFVSSS